MPELSQENKDRLLLCCGDGRHVFRVFHNREPFYLSYWLTTDPTHIKYSNPYDFDVRLLGFDESNGDLASLSNPQTDYQKAVSKLFQKRLEQAIDEGKITFPPCEPGELQKAC